MNGIPEPTLILDPYGYRSHGFKKARDLFKAIDEKYDPSQKEAARDAMIRGSIKVALGAKLPNHPLTAVIYGAGVVAKDLEKRVANFQCPKEEFTPIMAEFADFPTCNESKTALLYGLKGVQVPKNMLDETANVLSEYVIDKADKYGMTTENVQRIAKYAHHLIVQDAPDRLIRIYKTWIETPISSLQNRLKLSPEERKQFNTLINQGFQDRTSSAPFARLEAHFSHVFKDNREILTQLKEAKAFYDDLRKQENEKVKQEAWKQNVDQLNTIFSSLSHIGANLGIPILRDIGVLGNIGLSAATSISTLSSMTPAMTLSFATPCFALASAAIAFISFFNRDDEDGNAEFNQMLMEYLRVISSQINALRQEMHGRFDHVDKQLAAIHTTLDRGITVLRRSINNLTVPALMSLQDIRTAIEALYQTTNFKLDESLQREFEDVIDKIDNYVTGVTPRDALTKEEHINILRVLEKVILKQSSSPTFNGTVYNDSSAQGINRLLSTKDYGHIFGFLGLYAKSMLNVNDPTTDADKLRATSMLNVNDPATDVSKLELMRARARAIRSNDPAEKIRARSMLNVNNPATDADKLKATSTVNDVKNPAIDVSKLCNPYMWSVGVSRYLAFRKAFPLFDYDLEGIKMRELLTSGQAIFNYYNFLSAQTGIFATILETYKTHLSRLVESVRFHRNQKVKDLLKEAGFTTSQTDFMSGLDCGAISWSDNLLYEYKAMPYSGLGAPLPLDRFIKERKLIINWPYLLADRLGIGKLQFPYTYNCSRKAEYHGLIYKSQHFLLECGFRDKDNRLIVLDVRDITLSAVTAFYQVEASQATAWEQGSITHAQRSINGSKDNHSNLQYWNELLSEIQKTLFRAQQGFALSLLDSKSGAAAAEFSALVDEVEAQFKLLQAFGSVMGLSSQFEPLVSKLWGRDKMREYLLNQAKIDYHPDNKSLDWQLDCVVKNFNTSLIVPPLTSQRQPPLFIQQVERQLTALEDFADLYRLRRSLIQSMDRRIDFNPPEESREEETPDLKDKKIKRLENRIEDLTQSVAQLTLQNQQMLLMLQKLTGMPATQPTMVVQPASLSQPTPIVNSSASAPRYVIGGLTNFGNTCYLNAAIQGLLASPKFVRALQSMPNPPPLVGALQTVAHNKDIPQESARLQTSLRALHDSMIADRTNPDLLNARGTTQDSAAAFEAILGDCKYSLQLQTTLSAELVESTKSNENMILVHLPVYPNMSLQQIIHAEFSPKQQNDPNNAWRVTLSQGVEQSFTQYTITRKLLNPAPDLLVFQYARTDHRNPQSAYNGQDVECHPDSLLDMRPAGLNAQFRLVASINHHHPVVHYTAYVRKDNEWYHCDDSVVSKTASPPLAKATLLVYEKV